MVSVFINRYYVAVGVSYFVYAAIRRHVHLHAVLVGELVFQVVKHAVLVEHQPVACKVCSRIAYNLELHLLACHAFV